MKKQTLIKEIVMLILSVILTLPLNSCRKENNNTDNVKTKSFSGVWEFTLSPLKSYQDTTLVHGHTAKDFPEYSSTFSEVYLYMDQKNNIRGETLGYRILGSKSGNNVNLNLYVYPDGKYDEYISIDSMRLFSSMELEMDNFGHMTGTGNYSEYDDYPDIIKDTYEVNARKLSDITTSFKESKGWIDKLCNLGSKYSSYLISDLTDGYFRPMNSCYGEKDGGGYYVFGHTGPGNKLPIYTSTIYFPLEWSWCKVRKYDFKISMGGETRAYAKLKEVINTLDKTMDIIHKWGYNDKSKYFDDLDDFVDNFGGFAISVAYDTHTHNVAIYVNHEKGRNNNALSHPFILKLMDALNYEDGFSVSLKSGEVIKDSWHLRRSDFISCNSQLYIFYLIGTNKVYYD